MTSAVARLIVPLALLGALLACAHTEAAESTGPTALDGPHAAATPTRLTYEAGMDHVGSFSPDGATLLYAFQPAGRADRDRCLGLMPATGGTRTEICDEAVAHRNSTDAFEHPALNDDGALLYGAFTSTVGAPLVSSGELRLDAPPPGRYLLTLYGTATLPRFQSEFDVTPEQVPTVRVPVRYW